MASAMYFFFLAFAGSFFLGGLCTIGKALGFDCNHGDGDLGLLGSL